MQSLLKAPSFQHLLLESRYEAVYIFAYFNLDLLANQFRLLVPRTVPVIMSTRDNQKIWE